MAHTSRGEGCGRHCAGHLVCTRARCCTPLTSDCKATVCVLYWYANFTNKSLTHCTSESVASGLWSGAIALGCGASPSWQGHSTSKPSQNNLNENSSKDFAPALHQHGPRMAPAASTAPERPPPPQRPPNGPRRHNGPRTAPVASTAPEQPPSLYHYTPVARAGAVRVPFKQVLGLQPPHAIDMTLRYRHLTL